MNIRLTTPNGAATGRIDDSPAGRDLLSLLPLTLDMAELFSREKVSALPRALTSASEGQTTYSVAEIGYWPPTHDIVFFHADTPGGNDIPAPGNVHLGTITSGLDLLAAAGTSFTLTIEQG